MHVFVASVGRRPATSVCGGAVKLDDMDIKEQCDPTGAEAKGCIGEILAPRRPFYNAAALR